MYQSITSCFGVHLCYFERLSTPDEINSFTDLLSDNSGRWNYYLTMHRSPYDECLHIIFFDRDVFQDYLNQMNLKMRHQNRRHLKLVSQI